MKNQKSLFNLFLLKYNKYRAKLERFKITNRNEHRQRVLTKHIERLRQKLFSLYLSIKKGAIVATLSTAMVVMSPNAKAQITFAGGPGFLENPFSLVDIGDFSSVKFVDIDGDGDLDLFSGEYGGNFKYIENTAGAGNTPIFGAVQTNFFSLTDIGDNSSVEIVDIDGDGDLDLISGGAFGNFHYFENTAGTGNTPAFGTVQINPFSLTDIGDLSNVDLVDLDGDGDLDLFSGELSGDINYFENTAGAGNTPIFGTVQVNPFSLTNVGLFSNVELKDIDNDGDLDLFSGVQNGNFKYFENTAGAGNTPSFVAVQTNPFSLVDIGNQSNVELVDIDGDGDLDLFSGESLGNFLYFENIGTASNPDFYLPKLEINPFSLTYIGERSNVELIDIDSDGDLDLFSGSYFGNFKYFENTAGTGNIPVFAGVQNNPFSLTSVGAYSTVELADIDGDGDLDLFSGGYYGNFYYYENTAGAGNIPVFGIKQTNPFSLTFAVSKTNVKLVDIDNDGDLDLFSGLSSGDFIFFENLAGSGNSPIFGTVQTNPFSLTSIGGRSNVELVDFDNDGDLDLFSGDFSGDFNFFENTAGAGNTPVFGAVQTNPFSLTNIAYNTTVELVDIDGDGDLDLFSGDGNGNFHYFENITCKAIDVTTTINNQIITANEPDASYQWLDCDNGNSIIVGETNSSFTPTSNGTFSVKITKENCSEISECVIISNVAINEINFNNLKVFPNPTSGILNISVNEKLISISLKDITGKTVKTFKANTTQLDVSNINSGIYFLEVANDVKKSVVKLIIR